MKLNVYSIFIKLLFMQNCINLSIESLADIIDSLWINLFKLNMFVHLKWNMKEIYRFVAV